MKGNLKQYVMIFLGVVMIAVGIHFFLLPSHLALGGATGMALIFSKLISNFVVLPVSYLIVIVNIFLFVLGFVVIGNSFGIKTIVATLCLSGLLALFEMIIPIQEPLVDDIFLQLIIAIMFYAIGVGLVLNNYASTGGSDIIALILQKYIGIDLGIGCLLTDFVITLSMGLLYGANTAFYSLVGVIMNGLVIDKTINGLNSSRYCIINTNCPDKVCDFLLSMGRSANIYSVVGAYKKNTQSVVHTVLSRRDFVKLKEFLSKNDETSFMVVTNAHSVFGYHWRAIKD
ncbi:MAG: YitT family protein [Treponema sp.]